MSYQEKIHIQALTHGDLEKVNTIDGYQIAGAIGFGDNKSLPENLPNIVSHNNYRHNKGVYMKGNKHCLTHLFTIESSQELKTGLYKNIKYSESVEYIIGAIQITEVGNNNGDELIRISEEAYNNIYELTQQKNKMNLVRIGNYVTNILGATSITVDKRQVETTRYKAFCIGRSRSLDNLFGLKTNELPTATGIGNHLEKQGLQVFFIATNRDDIQHHKNPKQTNPTDYDKDKYGISQISGQTSTPRFSRATTISNQKMLFVGGTASILGQDVVYIGDVSKQTRQALQNIKYTMEEASKNTGIDFMNTPIILKVFVKHKKDFEGIKKMIESDENPLENTIIDTIYTQGDICRDEWLVEISCETVV